MAEARHATSALLRFHILLPLLSSQVVFIDNGHYVWEPGPNHVVSLPRLMDKLRAGALPALALPPAPAAPPSAPPPAAEPTRSSAAQNGAAPPSSNGQHRPAQHAAAAATNGTAPEEGAAAAASAAADADGAVDGAEDVAGVEPGAVSYELVGAQAYFTLYWGTPATSSLILPEVQARVGPQSFTPEVVAASAVEEEAEEEAGGGARGKGKWGTRPQVTVVMPGPREAEQAEEDQVRRRACRSRARLSAKHPSKLTRRRAARSDAWVVVGCAHVVRAPRRGCCGSSRSSSPTSWRLTCGPPPRPSSWWPTAPRRPPTLAVRAPLLPQHLLLTSCRAPSHRPPHRPVCAKALALLQDALPVAVASLLICRVPEPGAVCLPPGAPAAPKARDLGPAGLVAGAAAAVGGAATAIAMALSGAASTATTATTAATAAAAATGGAVAATGSLAAGGAVAAVAAAGVIASRLGWSARRCDHR